MKTEEIFNDRNKEIKKSLAKITVNDLAKLNKKFVSDKLLDLHSIKSLDLPEIDKEDVDNPEIELRDYKQTVVKMIQRAVVVYKFKIKGSGWIFKTVTKNTSKYIILLNKKNSILTIELHLNYYSDNLNEKVSKEVYNEISELIKMVESNIISNIKLCKEYNTNLPGFINENLNKVITTLNIQKNKNNNINPFNK